MKNLRIKISGLLVLAMVACGKPENRMMESSKTVVQPRRGDISLKVVATGTLSPLRRIEVKASDKGRVEKIFALEGLRVKESSVMALISPVDRIALLDTARAALYQAREKGDSQKIIEAERGLRVAESAYQPIPIVAPVSGEVIKKDLEIGELVAAEKTLFVISDRLVLKLMVNEADVGKIKIGQKVSFSLESFPGEEHPGRVERIAREGEEESSVIQYEVLVNPENVEKKWIAGMTVNAWFSVSEKKDVLILPLSALKRVGSQFYVIREGADQQKELRAVTRGQDDFQNVEILDGLTEKDRVFMLSQNEFNRFFQEGQDKKGLSRPPRF